MKCTECKGTGEIEVHSEMLMCPECFGKGEIKGKEPMSNTSETPINKNEDFSKFIQENIDRISKVAKGVGYAECYEDVSVILIQAMTDRVLLREDVEAITIDLEKKFRERYPTLPFPEKINL